MRAFCTSLAVLLSGCTADQPTLVDSALLLQESAEYNGKMVRVCGELVDDIEQCSIRPTPLPRTFTLSQLKNVIAIITPDQTCVPGNAHPMQGPQAKAWVQVDGIFHTGEEYGHLGGANHAIDALDVTRISGPCTR